jgi:hypothetical protein
MRDMTRYDLFKEDLAGNPCWIESIEGFVEAAALSVIQNWAIGRRLENVRLASARLGMRRTPEAQARDTNQGFLVRSAFAASRPLRSG